MTNLSSGLSRSESHPLRVAAVVDGDQVPSWVGRIFESWSSTPSCQLEATLIANSDLTEKCRADRTISSRIYELADARLFPPQPDALARRDLPPEIDVEHPDDVYDRNDSTVLGQASLSALEARRVDVVVGLGVPPLKADCPTAISFWSLDIGGRSTTSWGAGPVPELVTGRDLAVITLRESGPAPLLSGGMRRSVTGVVRWSDQLTRSKVMWSAASLVVHALRDAASRAPYPRAANLPLEQVELAPPPPSRRSTSAFALRQVARLAGHAAVRAVAKDEWHVAYRPQDSQLAFDQGDNYRLVKAPPGHSYADPLLFEDADRHWLFVEDLVYAQGKARIICLELDDRGAEGEIIPVLDEPHHLSYPLVLRRGNDIFMIPESGATNSIELYRAVSFPDRWERLGPIMSGLWGSDATLVEHNGLLWMFVTIAQPGMHPSDELHLYFASDLLGPWEPHRVNPVVSDVRAGRSAGRLFWQDGTLIRPAQDSARRYGHAINFQAVTQLTVDDFEEHTVGRLEGSQVHALATHTYTLDGRYEAIDFLRPTARWNR